MSLIPREVTDRLRARNNNFELVENKSDRIAKNIAKYTVKVARAYISAEGEERVNLNTAISILNQAQSVAAIDTNSANSLLSTARRIANLKD